jgi:hypothetical protein
VHDAADHAAVIDSVRAFTTSRQQRLNPLPFRIGKPINLLCHPSLQIASENLNHKSLAF